MRGSRWYRVQRRKQGKMRLKKPKPEVFAASTGEYNLFTGGRKIFVDATGERARLNRIVAGL
jgi:hypothetical protein